MSDTTDNSSSPTERNEYLVTEEIEAHYDTILNYMLSAMECHNGVGIGMLVSGSTVSARRAFTDLLGLALDNTSTKAAQPSIDSLGSQFKDASTRQLLKKLSTNYPTAVISVDLGNEQNAGAQPLDISSILYHQVLAYIGYSSADARIAQFELMLDKNDQYDAFKKEVEQQTGRPWSEIQNDTKHALEVAVKLAPKFSDKAFPNAGLSVDLIYSDERPGAVRIYDLLPLLQKKNGREYIVFILDDIKQYCGSNLNQIRKLNDFLLGLQRMGDSKVWLVATTPEAYADNQSDLPCRGLYRLYQKSFPIWVHLRGNQGFPYFDGVATSGN